MEADQNQSQSQPQNLSQNAGKQFRMLKPKVIKKILEKALGPGITSIMYVPFSAYAIYFYNLFYLSRQ